MSLLFALLFATFVAASVWTGTLSPLVPALYLGASLVTFAAYALDKSAAQKGQWRTRESTLHLLGLIGGWPGALVAQGVLRHKSKKRPFLIFFWSTVLLNCSGLLYFVGE